MDNIHKSRRERKGIESGKYIVTTANTLDFIAALTEWRRRQIRTSLIYVFNGIFFKLILHPLVYFLEINFCRLSDCSILIIYFLIYKFINGPIKLSDYQTHPNLFHFQLSDAINLEKDHAE
jgi:hypothetical protein